MELKTDTLNLRVTPELKELVRLAAAKEHRTVSNFVEVLVREHCTRQGIVPASIKRPKSSERDKKGIDERGRVTPVALTARPGR
jgi:hypothetical protein